MLSRDLGGVQGVRFLGVFEFSRQNGGDEKNRTDFPQKVAFWFQEWEPKISGKSREVGEI